MTKDVRESCIKMPLNFYLRNDGVMPIGASRKILDLVTAALNNLFRVAFQEYFANELQFGRLLRIWKVPRRIEGFGQGKMLLSDDSSRYSLFRRLAVIVVRRTKVAY